MKKLLCLFFLLHFAGILPAQNSTDTLKQITIDTVKKTLVKANADDPSQFITRIEFFNELQRYDKNGFYVNQTTLRSVFKVGKRFTTRIDIPFVYNSINTSGKYKSSGIGDISFRLLGYKFFEKKLSAFTASVEIQLNTAQSRILGTGKNIIIPVVSYTKAFPKKKVLFSVVFQQANSLWGDETRSDISFSKLQVLGLKYLGRRTWVVLAPEWFLDYVNGGLSMNLRTRCTHAPTPRINIWITPSAGIFGDFAGRYLWSLDVGARFFLLRGMNFKKKEGSK